LLLHGLRTPRALHSFPTRRSSGLRGALRWSVSRLRAIVDDGPVRRILADRESVAFRPEGMAVDLDSVRSLGNTDLRQLPAERIRSEEHTSELQSRENLVCRLLLEK